ncbi:hypothetical protein [Fibrobacter sp.]|uniref:hypothetical protein n=1 Tax=Fibrobacter sp. TaxID=35828 RepID=UPI00388ECBF6
MDFNAWHRHPVFSQVRLLSVAAAFLLAACLDIPDTPEPQNTASYVTVYAVQKGNADSTSLKIHPEDPTTLKAEVHPKGLESELNFSWYRDSLLGSGSTFKISAYPEEDEIPNRLVVKDGEGNSVSSDFEITVNSPPTFTEDFFPAQGDTLYGTARTSFTFSWKAYDNEDASLDYILELDTTHYYVGALEKIQQSGLQSGTHLFLVIVRDSEGDTDTLPPVKFYVVDTLEAKK